MTEKGRDTHRDDYRDDYRDDLHGVLSFTDHGLNGSRDDRDDYAANSDTRAHAQNKLGNSRPRPTLPTLTPRKARAAAWQAWLDAGQPWAPERDQPPGAVLDHALDACAADPMRAKWRR